MVCHLEASNRWSMCVIRLMIDRRRILQKVLTLLCACLLVLLLCSYLEYGIKEWIRIGVDAVVAERLVVPLLLQLTRIVAVILSVSSEGLRPSLIGFVYFIYEVFPPFLCHLMSLYAP